jgi:hypothetical protein
VRPAEFHLAGHPGRHGRPRRAQRFHHPAVHGADLPDVAYLEHLTSALYFDKKSEVDRYLLAMERLSIVAVKPSQSPDILTAIIDELEDELEEEQ